MQKEKNHWGEQGRDGLIHYHYDVRSDGAAVREGRTSSIHLQVGLAAQQGDRR